MKETACLLFFKSQMAVLANGVPSAEWSQGREHRQGPSLQVDAVPRVDGWQNIVRKCTSTKRERQELGTESGTAVVNVKHNEDIRCLQGAPVIPSRMLKPALPALSRSVW